MRKTELDGVKKEPELRRHNGYYNLAQSPLFKRSRTEILTSTAIPTKIPAYYDPETNAFIFNHVNYSVVSRHTRLFCGSVKLVSIGMQVDRRPIVTLDGESQELILFYVMFLETLKKAQNLELFSILCLLTKYVREIIKERDVKKIYQIAEQSAEGFVQTDGDIPTQVPVVSLINLLKLGAGVCPHFTLFTCYLLDRLMQDSIIPRGSIVHFREQTTELPHDWALYVHENKSVFWIDTAMGYTTTLAGLTYEQRKFYTEPTIETVEHFLDCNFRT